VAALLQLRAQLYVVVDLTVEDRPDCAILIVDRLLPRGDVDNRQSTHPERYGLTRVEACVIRPTVSHDRGHPLEHGTVGRAGEAADAAHALQL
jgi:hypothetical protein